MSLKPPAYERAVVIGGSMNGMFVARALSEHFREVVVIEKDVLPRDKPEHRKGVHQSHHIHNLLLRGQQEIEALFPGFRDTALALGAVPLDYTKSMAVRCEWGWSPTVESGIIGLSATRILLEHAVRTRFREQVENARLVEGTRVESLISEREGDAVRVVGVRTDSDDPSLSELRAALVVDCAGRGSRAPKWLSDMGLPAIEEEVVESHCAYSSRFFRAPGPDGHGGKGVIVDARFPDLPAWGALAPLEDNLYVLTLGGFNRYYPPTDEAGFTRYTEALMHPRIAQIIKQCEPVGPITMSRSMTMRWRHMERYPGKLTGYMLFGDSLWSYNPLYGQGMAIGSSVAGILRDELRRDANLATLAKRLYTRGGKFARPYWDSTALLDMRWPGTEGKRPLHLALAKRFGDIFMRACYQDRVLYMALMQIIHMLKPPTSLLRPSILARLAFAGIKLALPARTVEDEPLRLPSAS
jgi:flavin-dependent dehydrogenase